MKSFVTMLVLLACMVLSLLQTIRTEESKGATLEISDDAVDLMVYANP